MNTFCPNCEKNTDCNFDAELYSCNECEEDFAAYRKESLRRAYNAYKFYLHFFAKYIKSNEIPAEDWELHKKHEANMLEISKSL